MSPLPDWLRRGPEIPDDDRSATLSGGSRPRHGRLPADPVVFQAAALVLSYPEAELLDRLDVIGAALAETPAAEQFAPILAHLRGGTLSDLQAFHVQEFDLSRKHALHLSYWTDGDTRRRGEVLAEIKAVYRESGLVVDTGGELPDYLPMVLEFAVADPAHGRELLQRFRASVELIRLGLEADHLPHAGVLAAICGCLPGPSPQSRAEVQARFGEVQPVEFVGLSDVAVGPPHPVAEVRPRDGHATLPVAEVRPRNEDGVSKPAADPSRLARTSRPQGSPAPPMHRPPASPIEARS